MRPAIRTLLALCLVFTAASPVAADEATETDAAASPNSQIPNVRPFRSARFELSGTAKYDGITVDILGDGELALPDRQRAAFKFGPFTVEVIMVGDAVYTRSRFERTWSRQFVPQPVTVGPFSSSEVTRIERDVRLIGTEVVGGVRTEHYTATLDLRSLLESVAGPMIDREAREVLSTLRGSVDLWVGAEDRLIRQERLILAVTLPPIEPEGDRADATIDLTVAYSNLNDSVTIQEPPRNDPSPIRTPRPNITPVFGPPGAPSTSTQRPPGGPAPAQVPSR